MSRHVYEQNTKFIFLEFILFKFSVLTYIQNCISRCYIKILHLDDHSPLPITTEITPVKDNQIPETCRLIFLRLFLS